MTYILLALCLILAAAALHFFRQAKWWRDKAMGEARKRLKKDEKTDMIRRSIDRAAAKMIAAKDKEIADLQERLRYKTCVNERLWNQLRDLKAGGEFDAEE